MSDSPSAWRSLLGKLLLGLFLLLGFRTISWVIVGSHGLPGTEETVSAVEFHLLLGFALFLFREFSVFISDPRVWGALGILILFSVALAQVIGKRRARRHGSRWTARQTMALTILFMTLFAAPLVVGGGVRQAAEFFRTRWTTSTYATHRASVRMPMSQLHFRLWSIARKEAHFPDSFAELVGRDFQPELYLLHEDAELPPELPIYLAAGLPTTLDPSIPLLISPCYRGPAGVWTRMVSTIDGKLHEIEDSETDVWIQRALEAHRAHASP